MGHPYIVQKYSSRQVFGRNDDSKSSTSLSSVDAPCQSINVIMGATPMHLDAEWHTFQTRFLQYSSHLGEPLHQNARTVPQSHCSPQDNWPSTRSKRRFLSNSTSGNTISELVLKWERRLEQVYWNCKQSRGDIDTSNNFSRVTTYAQFCSQHYFSVRFEQTLFNFMSDCIDIMRDEWSKYETDKKITLFFFYFIRITDARVSYGALCGQSFVLQHQHVL